MINDEQELRDRVRELEDQVKALEGSAKHMGVRRESELTVLGMPLWAIAIGPDAVREAVSEFHPEDIAELLEDLSSKEAVLLVRALPTETAADVVERLSPRRQVLVFNAAASGR